MAVGVFEDDCGLTVVQYVRMDGEMTPRRHLSEPHTFAGHIPLHIRVDDELRESIVMPLHYIIRG